jgi:hypothetical protein
MAFTQADVDALDAAYKTGAQSTRLSDGRAVLLRSLDEYRDLRALMLADVAAAAATPARRHFYVGHTSGVE